MDCIDKDPSKIHVMNNYAMVEFIDDKLEDNKYGIILIKQNNSSKLRSVYVGRIIDRPDFMYTEKSNKVKCYLDDLVKNESLVAYNPMSVQVRINDPSTNKIYHIIRIEDVYCKLVDYDKEDLV